MRENRPPLFAAAEQGNRGKLIQLLGNGEAVDIRNSCHWTPLMKAALHGHLDVAKELLQAVAHPDLEDKGGYTALMLAASNNHAKIIELLIDNGASIDHVERTLGWNALIWSSKQGHLESVITLLKHHAETEHRDKSGKQALDWARENNHNRIAALIYQAKTINNVGKQ